MMNMAGKCKGAAAIIQRDYQKAIYVHCASHVLNLSLHCRTLWVTSSQAYFMLSLQSNRLKSKSTSYIASYEGNKMKLVDLCKTRWVARIAA